MNTLYIKTWGCQMNEYDSSKIAHLLYCTLGYQLIDNPENANILLLNTCSIREKAQEKVFHQLGRWKKIKDDNPNIIIGVGGCVASQEGESILNRANYVDIIFGPQTLHRLPYMINYVKTHNSHISDISFPELEKFNMFPIPRIEGGPSAFVTIMEGCNKYCSFCIVPFTRGPEISRPCDDIIKEIIYLSKHGIREVTLLGQNVNAYYGLSSEGNYCNFANLLEKISIIDNIDRIRFVTSHPIEFTDDLINAYKNIPKIANFIHLPVQSGSDKILSMMNRSYNILDYKNIVYKLRAVRPNIHISSDFIIGFPGESQNDFNETMNLIEEINFDMSFSFIYSTRPGTPAADLQDLTSYYEKKKRLYFLQDSIKRKAMQFSRRMKGTVQRILVEGMSKSKKQLLGRTENNRIVYFTGIPDIIGQFVNVEIIDVYPGSLSLLGTLQ